MDKYFIYKFDNEVSYTTISSSGNYTLVQFLTDHKDTSEGFVAYFHYIPIEPNCANWLNMNAQHIESTEYPTIDCSWVITAPLTGSTIGINFLTFEVKHIFALKNKY